MNLVVLGLYSYVYQSVISEQCHMGWHRFSPHRISRSSC